MIKNKDGFKKTKIGLVPRDWAIKALGDLCNGKPEYGANSPALDFNPNYPRYIRITDIRENGTLSKVNIKSISPEDGEKYVLEEGDILFARSGATVGKTYLYNPKDGYAAYAGYLIRFKPKKQELLPFYLKHFTHSSYYFNWVKNMLRAGAQPNINAKEYASLLIPLPSVKEQQKIVMILNSMNEIIEKTEAIIEQTEKIKEGIMQQIFTKGLDHKKFKVKEIGEIPEEWLFNPLENYCEQITYGFTNPMPTTEEGPYMITAKDIVNGKIQYNKARRTDKNKFENDLTAKSKPKIGDLLITKDGTLGRLAIVDLDGICINQSVATIRLKSGDIDVNYLYYLLASPRMQQRILFDAGGSTIKHIYITKLGKMSIPIPKSIKEQQKIVDILYSLDRKLEIESEKLMKIKTIKKGLMEGLFTGKIRVKVGGHEVTTS